MSKQPIKLLSLWQPWASLCIWKNPGDGKAEKQIETRSYSTDYTGLVAIHATKTIVWDARNEVGKNPILRTALLDRGINLYTMEKHLTLGAIIGVVELVKVVQIEEKQILLSLFPNREFFFGNYTAGRFGWVFTNPIEFKEPIYCRGLQSFGTPKPEIIEQIFEQMEVSR